MLAGQGDREAVVAMMHDRCMYVIYVCMYVVWYVMWYGCDDNVPVCCLMCVETFSSQSAFYCCLGRLGNGDSRVGELGAWRFCVNVEVGGMAVERISMPC